jgi:hypothetical protein
VHEDITGVGGKGLDGRVKSLIRLWPLSFKNDDVLTGNIGEDNTGMGGHQHVAVTTLEHLIKQVNDLSLPIIVEMYLGFVEEIKCLSGAKQRKQAHSPEEALLAIAQPCQQVHWRTFSLRPSPLGRHRSFEEHVDLLQHWLFMVNRCSQARQSFEKLQAVGKLFENALGDDVVPSGERRSTEAKRRMLYRDVVSSCQIENQQII